MSTSHARSVSAYIRLSAVLFPQVGIVNADALDLPSSPIELDLIERLGRKGQRYNTRSTLLALAAVGELSDALAAQEDTFGSDCGLVAASCYGNLAATCGVAEQLNDGAAARISPMDLPNASSNILASQIAIRHGITGVCLTVDDGLGSGNSAMRWADRLISSGRSSRVLIVAAECPSVYEETLRGGPPLVQGAIALLLEPVAARNHEIPVGEISTGDLPIWAKEYELASLGGLLSALRRSIRVVP